MMKKVLDNDYTSSLRLHEKRYVKARERLPVAMMKTQDLEVTPAYPYMHTAAKQLKKALGRRRLLHEKNIPSAPTNTGNQDGKDLPEEGDMRGNTDIETARLHAADIVAELRSRNGLDVPVPSDCRIESENLGAIGRHASAKEGEFHLTITSSCGCNTLIERAKARGFLSTNEINGVCKSALSHYAWKKRCNREREKYESLCANGAAEHFNNTAPFDLGKHEKLFKNINALSSYFMSSISVKNQCTALKQLINLRCIEENVIVRPVDDTGQEKRFMPYSPFDPRYMPRPTSYDAADNNMRFQQIDPSTLENFGTRIPDFMTP